MRIIQAASVQFESIAGNKKANLETMRSFVKQAAEEQANLIVFPECCVTGYWFLRKLSRPALLQLAEPVSTGPSSQAIQEMAAGYNMIVGAGFIEIDENNTLYNSYLVALPDGTVHCHRKIHAFINPEIACGTELTVFGTPLGWRCGVLICYDNNIIENARMLALRGTDLLLAPHQTGGCRSRSPHAMGAVDPSLWENRHQNPDAIEEEFRGPKGRGWLMRWLPSRAHDNGMFLIFSNGVGVDDDEIRTGNAMILDPYGRIVSETWKAGDEMITAELDPSLLENCTGRRWLRARRPTLYQPLCQAAGNEETMRKVRFGK